jgi:hypothetical protein
MDHARRYFLHMIAGAVILPAICRIAVAQTIMMRPVHLLIGYPRIGATDVISRLIPQWIAERHDRPIVSKDRLDAGGDAEAATAGCGKRSDFPLIRSALNAAQPLVMEFLRCWADQRLVGKGI